MITKRVLLCGVLTCALSPIAAGEGHAQDYPQRLIKLVVPGGPGNPGDLLARIAAQHLQATLGQSVIIENNAGAGGLIAARAFARTEPDGYTLFSGNTSTLAIIPAISKNPGYDPAKHFAPVAKVADTFQVLVVEPASPLKSVQDLIVRAKANPGQLNYGSVYGALPHLAGELFKATVGVNVVFVPYKTEPESNMAILAKQIQFSFPNVATALPLIREGTLRALAVTSATRRPELPDVPNSHRDRGPQLRRDEFLWRSRSGRYSEGRRRQAQRRDQPEPNYYRDAEKPGEVRSLDKHGHAAGIRDVHRCGEAEMDSGRDDSRNQTD